MSAGWWVGYVPESDSEDVHVMPIDDVVEHAPVDCLCGPRPELIKAHDGGDAWLQVHHSLDGREQRERDRQRTADD